MKTLIVNGDSWMFGSEILNPKIKPKMGEAITEKYLRPYASGLSMGGQ